MNEEFINVYIELMSKKIEDFTKNDLMMATRLTLAEKLIKALQQEKDNLLKENERLNVALNKKTSKFKEEF
jgi:hypothetical protein